MRAFTGGNGSDTTAAVLAYLAANKQLRMAQLYLIGEDDDPAAVWLTDYEAPLLWSCRGLFKTSVIKRGAIASRIGLEAESINLTWSPQNSTLTSSVATASPYQLARLGYFDNKRVRIWRTLMPTAGDANTFGAMELFGGFIGESQVESGSIKFSVNSYLYVLNQKVPSGLVENTNTLASYTGATPPNGFSVLPQFSVVVGSTPNRIYADQLTPTAGGIPVHDTLNDGYIVFNGGAGATLQGAYSVIGRNLTYADGNGNHHTEIILYSPLPWAPTPGVDTFYVSGDTPLNGVKGFPYVPSAQSAV